MLQIIENKETGEQFVSREDFEDMIKTYSSKVTSDGLNPVHKQIYDYLEQYYQNVLGEQMK